LTVLDAHAVVAYLRDEPGAASVAGLLTAREAALTAVGLGEVFDQLVRVAGGDEEEEEEEEEVALDLAELGLLDALGVDAALGAAAGRLRARHYHRTRCPVSMADCVVAETGRALARPVATSDPHLLGVCHAEDIGVIVLPGSDGSIWKPPQG
jgi:PIN domain nuclease of toxin-antitoxin system